MRCTCPLWSFGGVHVLHGSVRGVHVLYGSVRGVPVFHGPVRGPVLVDEVRGTFPLRQGQDGEGGNQE